MLCASSSGTLLVMQWVRCQESERYRRSDGSSFSLHCLAAACCASSILRVCSIRKHPLTNWKPFHDVQPSHRAPEMPISPSSDVSNHLIAPTANRSCCRPQSAYIPRKPIKVDMASILTVDVSPRMRDHLLDHALVLQILQCRARKRSINL